MKISPRKDSTTAAVLTVLTGTAVAQAIPLVVSPILTRLYSPQDFGFFAYFLSSVAILSVIATGRLEMALVLPRRDYVAVLLATGAIGLAGVVSVSLLVILSMAHASLDVSGMFGQAPPVWAYAVPVSVFIGGCYQVIAYWLNRHGRYRWIAMTRVSQTGAAAGTQILGGLAGYGPGGLILGNLVGLSAALLGAGCSVVRKWRSYARRASPRLVGRILFRHRRFAAFMIPGQLANIASSAIPVLLLGLLYGPAVAGFYGLAERTLFGPVAIVGTAVGDVYRQQASEAYRATGQCRDIFLRMLQRLALVALGPALVVTAAGPYIFGYVFGQSWTEAGRLAQLMAVMLFFQVVSTPLSHTLLFAGLQRWDMYWQFVRLAVAVLSISVASLFTQDHRFAVGCYAAGFAALYLSHSIMQAIAAYGKACDVGRAIVDPRQEI